MRKPEILIRWPDLRVPWLPLGNWPTPVRLASNGLWVKDESQTGTHFGGNKVRKLEHLLADVVRSAKRDVVTIGAIGSNHVQATALYGRDLGIVTHAVLAPQPDSEYVRCNYQRIVESCASVRHCGSNLAVPGGVARAMLALRQETGAWPYLIQTGGSQPLGTLGWVSGGLEIVRAVTEGRMPVPERVYVPFGSAGTAAGILLGLRLGGLEAEVVAVQVVDLPAGAEWLILRLARRTLALLRRSGAGIGPLSVGGLRVSKSWLSGWYGVSGPRVLEVLEQARVDGLQLDPTYSAKCFGAAMEEFKHDGRVSLFVNTANAKK